jgi:hypothetical protein
MMGLISRGLMLVRLCSVCWKGYFVQCAVWECKLVDMRKYAQDTFQV